MSGTRDPRHWIGLLTGYRVARRLPMSPERSRGGPVHRVEDHFLKRLRSLAPCLSGTILGLLILLLIRSLGGGTTSKPESLTDLPPVSEAYAYTSCDTIHRGETLGGVFLRNHMSMFEIGKILREIQRHNYFSPRSLLPGQVLEFRHDEGNNLVRLTCRISPERIYVFEMDSAQDTLRSYAQDVDAEIRVRKLSGVVKSTFEEALLAAGGQPRLAWALSDILSGDIDFFTEVHKGDAFSILLEERYVEGSFVGYGEILYGWYRGEEARAEFAYYRSPAGNGGHYDMNGVSLHRRFLRSPLNYRRVSSSYSERRFHPILRRYRPHHGVDYAAPTGSPVVSVADGLVAFAGWKGGYGRLVEVRHDPTHTTRYGHLSRFAEGIRKGTRIKQGQKVGFVGASGLATGPHLHYEMRVNGNPTNPLAVKLMPAEPIPKKDLADFRKLAQEFAASERLMAAGALLEPETWQGMLVAHNVTQDTTLTAD